MKGTPKSIVSIILAVAMVFSSVSWNVLASAAPETSGAPDAEVISQSEQAEASEASSELPSEAETSEAPDVSESSASAEEITSEADAVEAQDLEVADNVEAANNAEPLQLKLDDGSITLNVGPDGLTYTQGEVTQSYSGVVTITQSDARQQLTNTIVINDVPEGGTGVEDPTAYVNLANINTKGIFLIANNCKRDVVVTLMNGTENTLASGLMKNGDETSGTLTIQAEDGATEDTWGRLTATGESDSAGIGGKYRGSGSNIIISGGTVAATGGYYGAGIGGSDDGDGNNIMISGGTVTATGGYYGAGIGGGRKGYGSYITINGGNVTATGGDRAAGIGGGDGGYGSNIMISDAVVEAVGSDYGAGIGGGCNGIGSYITINGGDVAAKGEVFGAGIGGGYDGNGSNITINGGNVTVSGEGAGAGIGGGDGGYGSGITINGGDVTAYGRDYGAGIGGGRTGSGSDITINGGNVTAHGGGEAAGIGGGKDGSGSDITMNGGTVTATGSYYTLGIGGGKNGSAEKIYISGGSVNASSIGCQPVVSAEDATPVYLTQLAFNDGGSPVSNTLVTSLRSPYDDQPYAYGCNDAVTDEKGNFNAYLPAGTSIDAATVDGMEEELRSESIIVTQTSETSGTLYAPYDITVEQCERGVVSVDAENNKAYPGDTVRMSNYAVGGDVFDRYIVTDDSGNLVPVDGDTFVMPLCDVTVKGVFIYLAPVLYLDDGDITLNVGSETLTYTQGSRIDTTYTGTITIKQNSSETSNRVIINDVPEDGTNVLDPTAYVKLEDINTKGIFKIADNCKRNVTVILANGTDNVLRRGLRKSGGGVTGKLTIQAEAGATEETWGSLTATAESWESGIGGGNYQSGSNIEIAGGNVIATGGEYGAAGIGGGGSASYDYAGGDGSNITISGGNVKATGGRSAAGIGGGDDGDGSHITISGGIVEATGSGFGAAGIGGGEHGSGSNITISGGKVEATTGGGNSAAGIGGGALGNGSNITISGGDVVATGDKYGAGAGIGGGCYGSGSNITISGGTVTATGGHSGAGIGGGDQGNGSNITINGGTVTATGGNSGAGIGGGFQANGSNITISGGTVTATGGYDAAGIGGGGGASFDYERHGYVGGDGSNITISAGTVTATGGEHGAGIGGGGDAPGSDITISGGTVTATGGKGGVGIGGGYNGTAEKIYINGGSVNASAKKGKAIGCQPVVSAEDATPVYLTKLTFKKGEAPVSNTAVSGLTAAYYSQPYAYGLNDAATDENGVFYAYLPEYTAITAATVDGIEGELKTEATIVTTTEGASGTLFAPLDIMINQSSRGGTVSVVGGKSKAYPRTIVELSNNARDGYEFAGYIVTDQEGNLVPVDGDTFVMPASDVTVAGVFNGNYSIEAVPSENGSVTTNPIGSAGNGTIVTLNNTPDYGYILDRYIVTDVAGNSVTIKDDNTFEMPASDVTVTGVFIVCENPTLKLDDGDITLNVGSDSLTYTQGSAVDRTYSGTVIIKQNDPKKQLTNTITINDVSEGGTRLKDSTAYVNLADINTKGEFKIADNCKRNVVVTLMNETENTLASGLMKNGDETSGQLIIQAEDGATEDTWGSLIATGSYDEAGIGGGGKGNGSNIMISGGTVTATGGDRGAGIGGGGKGNGSNITISGGTVTVTGGYEGAGIGGGDQGNGSNIRISGGIVNAKGGTYGAGIGGGAWAIGSNITISEGTVKAIGGSYGAGIGGGYTAYYYDSGGDGSNITISGGIVNADGGYSAAGIGGGYEGNGSNITISGGTVTATGDEGSAGIGGGYASNGLDITISGGTVTATGGDHASGIGGGNRYVNGGDGSNITINGGTVTATGGNYGAGIGGGGDRYGGEGGDGSNITISAGTVTATGGEYGVGIGGGYNGTAEKIYINGGSVNASSIGCRPVVSAEDATPVYLTKLTFKNGEAPVSNTAVSGLTSTYNNQPYAYGLNDAVTDENGVFYAYLPENTVTTAATVDGIEGELKPETDIVTTTEEASGTLYVSTNIAVNPAVEELFR